MKEWKTETMQDWQREFDYKPATDREIRALAAAILRLIEWQHNMLKLKHEAQIKRMLKRQLLSRLRKDSELSLSN